MANLGYFNANFDPKTQLDAFNAIKCEHIYYDEAELFEAVKPGDVVILHELYCAGSTLVDALGFLNKLGSADAEFICIGSGLDSRVSKEVYRTLDAIYKFAQSEPKATRRRTRTAASGDSTASGDGSHRRGRASVDPSAVDHAIELYQSGASVKDVCQEVGLSQGTLYKYLRERGVSRK